VDNFHTEINVGFWQISEIRSSKADGTLETNPNGDLTGAADLEEYYSHQNLLKRPNNDTWETEGKGLTVDVYFKWNISNDIVLRGELIDLYNKFTLKNSGYSIGKFNTSGTFINSLGGVAYLPIYSGKEIEKDHNLTLPSRINLTGVYKLDTYNVLAKYKRQADVSFYYVGVENEDSSLRLLLDIKNLAPEFQYYHKWFTFKLAMDSAKLDQTQQLNLGVSLNYTF
jgi:hypothetical protein